LREHRCEQRGGFAPFADAGRGDVRLEAGEQRHRAFRIGAPLPRKRRKTAARVHRHGDHRVEARAQCRAAALERGGIAVRGPCEPFDEVRHRMQERHRRHPRACAAVGLPQDDAGQRRPDAAAEVEQRVLHGRRAAMDRKACRDGACGRGQNAARAGRAAPLARRRAQIRDGPDDDDRQRRQRMRRDRAGGRQAAQHPERQAGGEAAGGRALGLVGEAGPERGDRGPAQHRHMQPRRGDGRHDTDQPAAQRFGERQVVSAEIDEAPQSVASG
jgi:hypothetical protein